ncbi:MAG: iron-sulfur cluster assembly accessory protein [Trueperaceae bacterium]|nr:iron-sulfur cluster assembly accessory protein [Trueperaceae bacterium]
MDATQTNRADRTGADPTNEVQMTVTDSAAAKAVALLKEKDDQAAIRVFVKSGGCSGYMYGMAVDDRRLEGDREFEHKGVRLVVDKMSWPLLAGSEVDYVENMMGGGFSVHNPNASSSCGCGSSFRTDGSDAPDSEGSVGCST